MSTSTLKTEVAVLKNQVKELQDLKDISQEASEKIPLLEGRINTTESVTVELKKLQNKILENTQQMLIQQEKTSGELILIRKDLEHYIEEIQFLRKKMTEKADKSELNEVKAKMNDIEKELDEKPDRNELNRKIDRLWRFLYWVPGAVAAVIAFLITVFEQVKKLFS